MVYCGGCWGIIAYHCCITPGGKHRSRHAGGWIPPRRRCRTHRSRCPAHRPETDGQGIGSQSSCRSSVHLVPMWNPEAVLLYRLYWLFVFVFPHACMILYDSLVVFFQHKFDYSRLFQHGSHLSISVPTPSDSPRLNLCHVQLRSTVLLRRDQSIGGGALASAGARSRCPCPQGPQVQ